MENSEINFNRISNIKCLSNQDDSNENSSINYSFNNSINLNHNLSQKKDCFKDALDKMRSKYFQLRPKINDIIESGRFNFKKILYEKLKIQSIIIEEDKSINKDNIYYLSKEERENYLKNIKLKSENSYIINEASNNIKKINENENDRNNENHNNNDFGKNINININANININNIYQMNDNSQLFSLEETLSNVNNSIKKKEKNLDSSIYSDNTNLENLFKIKEIKLPDSNQKIKINISTTENQRFLNQKRLSNSDIYNNIIKNCFNNQTEIMKENDDLFNKIVKLYEDLRNLRMIKNKNYFDFDYYISETNVPKTSKINKSLVIKGKIVGIVMLKNGHVTNIGFTNQCFRLEDGNDINTFLKKVQNELIKKIIKLENEKD